MNALAGRVAAAVSTSVGVIKTAAAVLLIVLLGAGAYTATLAAAKPSLQAPTITSAPANPAGSTSANFSFTGATGSSFQCNLDGALFSACGSPKGYTSLGQGSHVFQVKAVSGSEQSSVTSYTWTIDTAAPPVPSITAKPAALSNVGSPSFSFSDAESSAGFRCALDSSAFASCTSPRSYSGLAQGTHAFAAQAVDAAGNSSASAMWSWTLDTVAPPLPVITQKPTDPTSNATNTFVWTETESGTSFQCSGENGDFASCTSPYTYVVDTSNNGQHQFAVRAIDGAGNVSGSATYSFKYDKGQPSSGVPFTISGSVSGLSIGVWKSINVTIGNPNSAAIYVSAINVSFATASDPASCPSGANMEIQPSNVSTSVQVLVAAGQSVVLPAQGATAPQIRLKDLPTTNQDGCKTKSFSLTYTGTAHN